VDTFADDLARRFAALPTPTDDSNWLDVRHRARRGRRARIAVAVAAATLVVAIATPAFGLQRIVIDWFSAEPAPERVQVDFDRLGVGAPSGMDPQVVPNSARKVMETDVDGQRRTLWVAPTKKGGYCFVWTDFLAGCAADPEAIAGGSRHPDDVSPALLGLTWQPDERGVPQLAGGHLHARARDTDQLTVEFADGTSATVPFVWVSAPIDAGFYIYAVPGEHRRVDHQVTAIVARDRDGHVLARQMFELTRPEDVLHAVRLPDGQMAEVPPNAVVERARKVIDFGSQNGGRVTLWLIPRQDGRYCYAYNRGGGCPPRALDVTMAAGLQGGPSVLFSGQVRPQVAAVELRYEDGKVERLKPIEGFVLYEIPSTHYPRGSRLEVAVAIDENGRVLESQQFDTHMFGIYPCDKPVDVGKGVMACP